MIRGSGSASAKRRSAFEVAEMSGPTRSMPMSWGAQLTTSEPPSDRWKILNHRDLLLWAHQADIPLETSVPVVEFFRDRVGVDPDFGEVIDDHTRGERVPGTDVEAIWTSNLQNGISRSSRPIRTTISSAIRQSPPVPRRYPPHQRPSRASSGEASAASCVAERRCSA